MRNELFSQLIKGLDERNLTDLLKEMISIRSENPFGEEPRPGYGEREMAGFLLAQMRRLGLEVESRPVKPGRPNVFGHWKGSSGGPSLMFAAHMDTARTDGYPDAYDVKQADGKIFGRGSCDMKAALAAYLETARILKEASVPLRGHLIIGGLIDEEYQMLGSKDVAMHGPGADWGIIGEPSQLAVCPAHKGRVSLVIRTLGKASHSSIPEQGDNAILKMGRLLQALSRYNEDLLKAPPHPLCGHGRFSPGVVRGGVQVNTVPDHCDLEVDRRTLPGETREEVYEEIRSRIEPLVREDPNFQYRLTDPICLVPPNDVPPGHPIVQSLLAAFASVTGKPPQPVCFQAGTDAPNLGFPTVICGPGSIAQAHAAREFVEIDELKKAVEIYLSVVLDRLM